MKIHVITDDRGNVLGTVHAIPGFDFRVVPLAGQNVHERELPKELEGVDDVDQLQRQLKSVLLPLPVELAEHALARVPASVLRTPIREGRTVAKQAFWLLLLFATLLVVSLGAIA